MATHRVPGFDVSVVDTNGAGDAHAGAFLAALAAGFPRAQAARRANAAAAIAVTRAGPATGPTASELDAFLASREISHVDAVAGAAQTMLPVRRRCASYRGRIVDEVAHRRARGSGTGDGCGDRIPARDWAEPATACGSDPTVK